jgi:hypothetical protein
MAQRGLVYVGSYWFENDQNRRVYAADVRDARSIASIYNEPTTVFDVPVQAPQGSVYGRFIPHPDNVALGLTPAPADTDDPDDPPAPWTPLTITIKPDGKQRVVNLTWRPHGGAEPKHELLDDAGRNLVDQPTLAAVTSRFDRLGKAGKDVFVTFKPGDEVKLGRLEAICELIKRIDTIEGIRVEPPPDGHLYYRAFLPNPKWRKPEGRVLHGWDLHITTRGPDRPPKLELIASQDQRNEAGRWIVVQTRHAVESPDEIAAIVEKVDTRGPREIHVHAPAKMTYGRLMDLLRPTLATHNTIHLYLDR